MKTQQSKQVRHTPGPWKIVTNPNGTQYISDRNGNSACVKQNASIIAAAPELLEALENLLKQVGVWFPGSVPTQITEAVYQSRVAIKNARGES